MPDSKLFSWRRCTRCGTEKPDHDFMWSRKGKKRDVYCRPCRAAYKQEHYRKHRQRYIDNAAARTKRVLEERMRFVIGYLAERGCTDCGEKDPIVLEFDHLGGKRFTVAHGIRERRWDEVLAEIAKCEVVCSNCHRRRTARRGGFMRAALCDEKSG